MKLFAPNVLVVGDTIYDGEADMVGKPNPPAAAARYEAEVMAMQAKIVARPFGARWLEIVGNNGEPITIVPSRDTRDAVTQTFPDDASNWNRTGDAVEAGLVYPGAFGTSRGAATRVKFNPAVVVGNFSASASGVVVLVHELTHAYRSANGRYSPALMPALIEPARLRANPDLGQRFHDWEEFLAVVVESVFAAEQGQSFVRMSWDVLHAESAYNPAGYKFWNISPPPGGTDSENFAADYRPALGRIREAEPDLYGALLDAPSWFNPIRDLSRASALMRN